MSAIYTENPVFFFMAAIATVLYLVKILLLVFGGDSSDGDLSDSSDLDTHHADGGATFSLVSMQSILAFFMGTGWIGLAAKREWGLTNLEAVLIAAGFGFLMALLSALLTFQIKKLNSKPSFDMSSLVGKKGRAYTNIPEKGHGFGQVEIAINGKLQIVQAQSSGEPIRSFVSVQVESIDDSGFLTVAGHSTNS